MRESESILSSEVSLSDFSVESDISRVFCGPGECVFNNTARCRLGVQQVSLYTIVILYVVLSQPVIL